MLDAKEDPLARTGSKAVLVRKKVKHALNAGVEVHEYLSEDPEVEKQIEVTGTSWLHARKGAQIYIAHLDFFHHREGKRWFYATHEGKVIGFLILNQLQASSGWLLNNLIVTPEAPSGTSELLITTTFKALGAEESTRILVGPVTTERLHKISGLGSFSTWLTRSLFRALKMVFRLQGQTVFWEKFQPTQEPCCLIFEKINLRTIRALMRAMNAKVG
jgi:lysylphosphatidylglycerol synthetase-like protein (DUF2156 family)